MKLLLFIGLSVWSVLSAGRTAANHLKQDKFEVVLMLKNNPPFHLYHKLPYKTFDWHSRPGLDVRITLPELINNFVVGVKVLNSNNAVIFTGADSVKTESVSSSVSFAFDNALTDPAGIEIEVMKHNKILYKKTLPVDLVRFYGTVTDFNNRPVSGAWIITLGNPFQIVTSNSKGEYEMYLPEGKYNCIAVLTKQYPDSILENYIWNIRLDDNFKYDFKIDKAEVFRLMASAMPQNRTISGSFIGWTCSGINKWMGSKTTANYEQDDMMFSEEYLPALKREHVKFYLDDIEISEVPVFEKTNVLIPENKVFNAGYKFEFLIPKGLPKKEYHTLRVEIHYPSVDKYGNAVIEKGQGTLHDIVLY